MSIFKSSRARIGWTIEPCFIITLHVRDVELLNSIQNFFSVGSVSIFKQTARFRVRSRSELSVIIDHFNKYPLQTTKVINFRYFCEILNLLNKKMHTSISGFLRLASFINKLNNPLSESLITKLLELGVLPVVEFETNCSLSKGEILNPFWLSGFASGEGSFTYFTRSRITNEIVKDYSFVFEVSQNTRDLHILNLIHSYFKTGSVYTDTKRVSRYRLRVNKNNLYLLTSHFCNYPLIGYKAIQYLTWLKIVEYLNHKDKTKVYSKKDIKLEKLLVELSNLK